MTRRDYIAFAKVLANNRPHEATTANTFQADLWRAVRMGMVEVFQRDNSRFDCERFFKATEE